MNFDALIIGGSFAGLAAAMPLVRARRKVLLIDGGTPRNRFSDASHGFFGLDGRSPAEISKLGLEQLGRYSTFKHLPAQADSVKGDLDAFVVSVGADIYRARRVVFATGVTDVMPDIEGFAERWGRSIVHCPYCHGYETADRPTAVLYATPGSLHQVRMLQDWTGDVTLLTNGHAVPPEEIQALHAVGIETVEGRVLRLEGDGRELETIHLEGGRNLTARVLYAAPFQKPTSDLPEQLGCAYTDGLLGPILQVDGGQMTTVPGAYAAGDAARAMQNATFAVNDGSWAGINVHRSLML
ncbi:NAD(P)/FAD-dependent oxidoreductase [bacterium]|nr:MAG: NAD(P)/FAD-dependent oxidoreductase [bacterium]